ncbi:RidA family protein [Streptomyces sp. UG1]|uniref:RidA family protein n=1 Tax=Streptomyces sp. UG1 TaxID=3417652 RepID=UPI003CF358FA
MPKQEIISPELAVPNGHFAQATVAEARGRLLFVSGMTARAKDGTVTGVGDITAQTHQVCQNLRAAVEAAGGTLDDIARVDVYVRNMEDFDAIHAVRRQYFTGVAPASTMVEVSKFVNKDYLIEINAIAAIQD